MKITREKDTQYWLSYFEKLYFASVNFGVELKKDMERRKDERIKKGRAR